MILFSGLERGEVDKHFEMIFGTSIYGGSDEGWCITAHKNGFTSLMAVKGADGKYTIEEFESVEFESEPWDWYEL